MTEAESPPVVSEPPLQDTEANPRVRVKGSLSSSAWRAGTAEILDDDDPKERARILGRRQPVAPALLASLGLGRHEPVVDPHRPGSRMTDFVHVKDLMKLLGQVSGPQAHPSS